MPQQLPDENAPREDSGGDSRPVAAATADLLRQSIVDSLPFSVIATDTEGNIVAANPAADRLLGFAHEELLGRSVLILHDTRELERRARGLSRMIGITIPPNFQVIVASGSQGAADEREWVYVRKDGGRLPVNLAITSLRDTTGRVSGFLNVAYDITMRKRAEAFIRHTAHHDALTGLPNRSLLLDRLHVGLSQSRRHGSRLAVLMLDLDRFKAVNDALGHQIGDRLLLAVGQRLRRCVRAEDTVARLGGDEFVLLLAQAPSGGELTPLLHKIVDTIGAPIVLDGHELLITPSIGCSLFPLDGDDAVTLLKNADTAMYHAKAGGRGHFRWFESSMHQRSEDNLALGAALRRAIESSELSIHYQPEVSLRNGRVIGMEALVRWHSLGQGSVPPNRFVPIAEETGLIQQLGEWVLRTACHDCMAIGRSLDRNLTLAVNVSPRQFRRKDWLPIVESALESSGLAAEQLEIEITEDMLVQNPEESARILRVLCEMGVGVVVDDFGTGYSSLSSLVRYPIDKIKIDRSFIGDLATGAPSTATVDAIIAMAHSLDIRVIAEGVETEQQMRHLRNRGCDQAQGYHYGPPVPLAEFQALYRTLEPRPG